MMIKPDDRIKRRDEKKNVPLTERTVPSSAFNWPFLFSRAPVFSKVIMLEYRGSRPPSTREAVVEDFLEEPLPFAATEALPLDGCLRFFEPAADPLLAFRLAEKVDVPGMASLEPELECAPLVVAWPRRVLAAGPFSLSVAGEPLVAPVCWAAPRLEELLAALDEGAGLLVISKSRSRSRSSA